MVRGGSTVTMQVARMMAAVANGGVLMHPMLVREGRDPGRVGQALDQLRIACQGSENTMPFILDCVRAYCTLGEICRVFREVFGEYREPVIL